MPGAARHRKKETLRMKHLLICTVAGITFATAPLYPHYATLGSPYGIDALADQQLAGGIMWIAGDIVFILALLVVVAAWMRHEERNTTAAERRAKAAREEAEFARRAADARKAEVEEAEQLLVASQAALSDLERGGS